VLIRRLAGRSASVKHRSAICLTVYSGLAEEIKLAGARAFIQLFHVGRQGSSKLNGAAQIVAPSAIPCPMNKEMLGS
jgi:2,4-dienoyl-CoA reductase-like NADH-dependent reductase (Old Yellow Enzyme family)